MSAPAAAVQSTGDTAGRLTTREFFDGVREGRLVVQRCAACGALAVPPKAVCPECEGESWSRTALGGDGEVTSYTVIRVPPARLAAEAPYVVAVIRMAEGVSLLGRLTGAPVDAVQVGMRVRFAGSLANADPPVIAFRPR
ncbi:MAG TPA: Zn-ribbon domain-containing OB-fold protein [Methylomirabilota bacterium]|nr:Zn-ribbon domain-containing OB-fold protein [Methylomirabilota bacterium]